MYGKRWIVTGAILAAVAVALGAFGAHGLESWLPVYYPNDAPRRLGSWQTAVTYQMYHAIGLILIGIVARLTQPNRGLLVAPFFLLAGVLLFSGMLAAWVVTDIHGLVMIVPIGGVCFILGWVCFAMGVARAKFRD